MANTKSDWSVPNLTAPSLSAPQLWAPSLPAPQLIPSGKSAKREDTVYRRAVDLGDVLLGGPTGTRQLQNTLRHYDYDYLVYVPVINKLVGAGLVIQDRTINPLLKGDIKTMAVNTLESTAHSFDILANPVKSLMPWAGGGSSTDLLKSMGWASGEYREYYQWDTGNVALDFIGEFISDPITWFTLGSAAVEKATAKAAVETEEQITKLVAKEIGEEALEKGAIDPTVVKNFTRELLTTTADESKQVIQKFINELAASSATLDKQLKAIPIKSEDYFELLELLNAWPKSPKQLKGLANAIYEMRNSKLYRTYDTIRGFKAAADSVQKTITVGSSILAPVGGVSSFVIKKLVVPTFQSAFNKFIKSLKPVVEKEMTPEVYRGLAQEIVMNNSAIHKPVYSTFDKVFADYNYQQEDLIKLYVNLYNNTPVSMRDADTFDDLFKEELLKRMPRLNTLVDERDFAKSMDPLLKVTKEGATNLVTPQQVDDLVSAISDGGRLLIQLNDVSTAMYQNKAIADVEKFWSKNAVNKVSGFKQIEVAVENLQTKYPDFKLENLIEFLSKLQYENEEEFLHYAYVFNYIGITKDNVQQVAELLKHPTSESLKQLEEILTRGKTGWALLKETVEQNKKYGDELVKGITKDYRIDVFNDTDLNDKFYKNLEARANKNAITEVKQFAIDINTTKQDLLKIRNSVEELADTAQGRLKVLLRGPDLLLDTITNPYLKQFTSDLTYVYSILGYDTFAKDSLFEKKYLEKLIEAYQRLEQEPDRLGKKLAMLKHFEEFRDVAPEYYEFYLQASKVLDIVDQVGTKNVVANVKDLLKTGEDLFIYTTAEHGDLLAVTSNMAQAGLDKDTWLMLSDNNSSLRDNIRVATSKLRAGITPDVNYKLVPNLKNANGDSVLARTNKDGQVFIKKDITKKEFFDYIQGVGDRSVTSQQKLAVMQALQGSAGLGADGMPKYDIASLKKLIKTKEDIYYFLYQHEYSHIKNNDITKYISGVENLLSKNNIKIETRATKDAVDALINQKKRVNLATYIDTMFSTIDGTNNANRLLGNIPVLEITEDTKMRKYLQGLMYNMLYKYKDNAATSFLEPAMFDTVVDDFMQQATRDNKLLFTNNPEIAERLRNNFSNAFKDYINTQVAIGISNHTDLNLLQTWNYGWFNDIYGERKNAAQIFDTIGLSYKPVLESLVKAKVDPQVIADTSTAIKFLSNNVPAEDFERTNARITAYANKQLNNKEVYKYIDKQLERVYTRTLSDAIENTEKEISLVNKYLTQSQRLADKYWSAEGEEQAKNALAIMLASETDEFTKSMGQYSNRYNSTTAHQHLGFKKVYDQTFIKNNHLDPSEFPNVTNKGYSLLYNKMDSMREFLAGRIFNDKDETSIIRNGLISLFMDNPTLEYAPKNPIEYFNRLDDMQLKMWDMTISDNNLGVQGSNIYRNLKYAFTENRRYTYSQKIQYRTTPESMYQALSESAQRRGVTDTAIMYKQQCRKLDINEYYGNRGIHDIITNNFDEYIKAPEDLGRYRMDVNNYIQHDLNAYNDLRDLDQLIAPNNASVGSKLSEITQDDEAKFEYYSNRLGNWGIDLSDSMSNGKVRQFYTQERNVIKNLSYDSWDAFQLRDYIDMDSPDLGFVVYGVPKYKAATELHLGNKFTPEELKEAGLKIIPLKKNNLYVIQRTSNEVLGKAHHTWELPDFIFKEEQEIITNTIDKMKPYLRYDKCTIPSDLWTGDSITMDDMRLILENDELKGLVKDLDLEEFLSNKKPIPNTMFIGDTDTYNEFFYNTDMTAPADKIAPTPMTSLTDRELWTTATLSIDADNTDNKIIQLFFNNDFDSDNAMYRTVFKDATDSEIKSIFKRNNWVAAVLREDTKGRPKVYKYFVNNKKTLEEAQKLGAIIIPHESYRTLVLGLNKHAITNKLLRSYLAVCSLYKSIYLTTPGFLMRNEWDSNYIKNLSSTRGMSSFFDNVSYRYKARKLNAWYEQVQKDIAKMAEEEVGKEVINKKFTQQFLKTLSEEDQKLYIMLDMFNRTPASAGLSEVMQKILFEYNDANGVINRTAIENWLNKSIYEYGPVKWVNSINDTIERDARLSLFLNLTDHGLSPDDAIRKIIETHFDYELSAFQLKPVEQLMWFSVFPFNNLSYYLNEGITKNTDVLKFQLDLMELSWNNGRYTWDDVRKNDYYFYNVMAGNIRFMVGDKDILLKLGSSVMDFFQLLADPTGALKDRINPFLSVLLGLEGPAELNPFNANISRVKQIREGRSYVPSVYTKLTRKEYKKKNYVPRYPKKGGGGWTKYPKRIPRPSNKAKQLFTATTYRYYFSRGKNRRRWLTSSTSIEPHWYHNNYRYRRSLRKYLTKSVQLKHIR